MTWMKFSGTLPPIEIVRAADGSTLDRTTIFMETFGYNLIAKQTQVAELMLSQRWHNVYDVAPTSNLRLFNVLCCLGITLVTPWSQL